MRVLTAREQRLFARPFGSQVSTGRQAGRQPRVATVHSVQSAFKPQIKWASVYGCAHTGEENHGCLSVISTLLLHHFLARFLCKRHIRKKKKVFPYLPKLYLPF